VNAAPAPWCAALARALDEPLPGTAPVAPRWLCLEHRGTWPSDILTHSDPSVRALLRRAAAAGWRPLLVRRPGRRPTDGPTRVFLADTAVDSPRTTVLRVPDPAELPELPLPGPGAPLPGDDVPDPLLMVCTHGRRDRCCAVDGRALARALAATGPSDVWECTHLGGHRFAPTAVVLPTGYVYGRLDAGVAAAVHKAAAVGEMEAGLCRGRSTWSPPGQVAELAVRAATGLRDADGLSVGAVTDAGPDVVRVSVTARDGRRWLVTVQASDLPQERPTSCGAAALPLSTLHATGVARA
jgi:hypothetical protein